MLSLIRTRHLRAFIEVARLCSVSLAADKLSVTQPAISKTIKELENLLSVRLFDRSHRILDLTPAGKAFLRYAETSVVALRQGIEELTDLQGNINPVRIGALPTVSARILPKVIEDFEQQGGQAIPEIITGPNAYLIQLLLGGGVDIIIGRMGHPDEMAGLHFEHLYSEPICFVVRKDHPLLKAKNFDPAAMQNFEMIIPNKKAIIRPTFDRLMLMADLPKGERLIETVSSSFSKAYLRRSDAIWVISQGVVYNDVKDGFLCTLPIDCSGTMGPVGMTLRAETPVLPDVDHLMRIIRQRASHITSAS